MAAGRPAARGTAPARWLVAAGVLGLVLIIAQGFAIGLRGWSWSFLGALFGEPGPSQAGMGSAPR